MSRLADHPLAGRVAALVLLGALVWVVAPVFVAPVATYLDQREQLAVERAILARLGRLDERKAAIARLSAGPDAAVFVGDDLNAVVSLLNARVFAAAPPAAMEITSFEAGPSSKAPGAPLEVRLSLRATMGGFDAFLRDVETRPPFMTVETMKLGRTEAAASGDPIVLAGSLTLSAVALIRGTP